MDTALTVLSHLIFDEVYARKVLPFIKPEYFDRKHFTVVFNLLTKFVYKYNAFPTKEALLVELKEVSEKGISDSLIKDARDLIIDINREDENNTQWLVDTTEKWCKERALENALTKAFEIMDGKDKELGRGAIPQLLADALGVSFDNHVGHDYLEDAESRYEFYHTKEKKIPFSLAALNAITDGGLSPKTLNVFMAVTGGGKSRFMCGEAAFQLMQGYNVLYITAEMAEERISERIDANLLDIPIHELKTYPKGMFANKIEQIKRSTQGRLVVKEFPTASAGANHFRYLLTELKLKKNFVPDIIYIDYINICISSRVKMGPNVASYGFIKSIAEELRGLGGEYNVPIVSATQINRDGFRNSDIEMDNVSESIGLPATCDLLMAIMLPKEQVDQIAFKQLKNRYGDTSKFRTFNVGVDKEKMRLYDLDNRTEDEKPVMDNTEFGRRDDTKKKDDWGGFE